MSDPARVIVTRWVDGDTFHGLYRATVATEVTVQLPWQPDRPIQVRQEGMAVIPVTVRCYGFNAPELRGRTGVAGQAARAYVEQLAPVGSEVRLRSAPHPEEKYGRWLAQVELPDGRDLAHEMIVAGHAAAYFGGNRP